MTPLSGHPLESLMFEWRRGKMFDGNTYDPLLDWRRLNAQSARVFIVMNDKEWRTLAEIEAITGDPQASISARLRDLRKDKFGGHTVRKRRRGEPGRGVWEYQLLINTTYVVWSELILPSQIVGGISDY